MFSEPLSVTLRYAPNLDTGAISTLPKVNATLKLAGVKSCSPPRDADAEAYDMVEVPK